MPTYTCTLELAQRPRPVVDGRAFEGELLRYVLVAAPQGAGGGRAAHSLTVELRLARGLLDAGGWQRLTAAQVAACGAAYVRERLQRDGLPPGQPHVLTLDAATDGGAYRAGPPWRPHELPTGRPFEVLASDETAAP